MNLFTRQTIACYTGDSVVPMMVGFTTTCTIGTQFESRSLGGELVKHYM